MRLSVWGVPEDMKTTAKEDGPSATSPKPKKHKQTMTREDIMRNYK